MVERFGECEGRELTGVNLVSAEFADDALKAAAHAEAFDIDGSGNAILVHHFELRRESLLPSDEQFENWRSKGLCGRVMRII
jgi:hypothetical protein